MTRKAALAKLRLGGGKAVVRGDPATRSREQLRAFGEFVDSLGGRYITAADMGTGEEEMAAIAELTPHVVGLPESRGGCGEPAPFTALGVLLAMEAALAELSAPLRGARVAVQGVGRVGSALVDLLRERGASLVVSDPDPEALASLPEATEVVPPEWILHAACDVLAPCGPPDVLDSTGVSELRCRVVCGAANNPLSDPEVASLLHERRILYVPDYLANAGGLIHLAVALEGGDANDTRRRLGVIPENLEQVLALSKSEGIDTATAAEKLSLSRLAEGGHPSHLG
jgi:glutamate dehydrogenase/leucine dehydrogenase